MEMKQTTLNFKKIVAKSVSVDVPVDGTSNIEINSDVLGNKSLVPEFSLSDYELVRLSNIERNAAFLATIGVEISASHNISCNNSEKKRKSPRPEVKKTERLIGVGPTRKSSRLSKSSDGAVQAVESPSSEFTDQVAFEISYTESAAAQHIQRLTTGTLFFDQSTQVLSDSSLMIVDEHNTNIACIYTMDFNPKSPTGCTLLMAAGKGGDLVLLDMQRRKTDHSSEGVEGLDTATSVDPIMAFRAHSRWISSAKFVNPSVIKNYVLAADNLSEHASPHWPLLALTASDDSTIKLWDLTKSSSSAAKLLYQSGDTLHAKGIFCMDYHFDRGLILTGSKDKTVRISTLQCIGGQGDDGDGDGDGVSSSARSDQHLQLDTLRVFEYHSKVVKTVAWQKEGQGDGNIIASGGQDRCVCIKDIRSSSSTADITLENVHEGSVHTVSWAPLNIHSPLTSADRDSHTTCYDDVYSSSNNNSNQDHSIQPPLLMDLLRCENGRKFSWQNLLLTAGMDKVVKAYDLRKPDPTAPLFSFSGHVAEGVRKVSSIVPPCFLSPHIIATAGEGWDVLSLYCLRTGSVLSRERLPFPPGSIAWCNLARASTKTGGDDFKYMAQFVVAARSGGIIYYLWRPFLEH